MTRSAGRFAATAFAATLAAFGASAQDSEPMACATCHHPTGTAEGMEALRYAPYPQIAGMPSRYIAQQLRAYRDGTRSHTLMSYVASQLSDEEIARWARSYGAARIVQEEGHEEEAGRSGEDTLGQQIAEDGLWERGVPPCQSCHGEGGQRPTLSPELHGLSHGYIFAQLRAYAEGRRNSDRLRRMNAYAGRLTEEEMSAVAAFYGGRGETMPEAAR